MCGGAAEKFFEDTMPIATLGLADYEDGKFKSGPLTNKGIDITKDITGATAAEEANADARARFEEEKALALKAREDAKAENAADQLAKSRGAASARSGRARTTGTRSSGIGQDERDFLGL